MNLGLGLSICAPRAAIAIFDPATISNMVVRWRASQAVTSSGGTLIDSIPNEGTLGAGAGNVNNLAFNTGRPKYTAASATFGGKPSILFDGVQLLQTGTLSTAIAQPSTFYAYTSIVDSATANQIMVRINGGTTANAATLQILPSTDTIAYTENGTNQIAGSSAMYGKRLSCVVYNGTSTALYIDDMTTAVATAALGGVGACNTVRMGILNAALAPFELPEQIGYSGAHNAATRAQIASYFTGTYG